MISYKKFGGYDGWRYHKDFRVLKNMSMLENTILNDAWSPIIWKDGERRSSNFIESHFLALDFDQPGDESMLEINDSLKDFKRIIATTKSHGKDKGGITCDRFRLILPFDKPITNVDEYIYNVKLAMKRFSHADKSCFDAGRFFFPSNKIIVIDRESQYTWETKPYIPITNITTTPLYQPIKTRTLNTFTKSFINYGIYYDSRNLTTFKCALDMFQADFTESEIEEILGRAVIDWQDVDLKKRINSARKKYEEKKVRRADHNKNDS